MNQTSPAGSQQAPPDRLRPLRPLPPQLCLPPLLPPGGRPGRAAPAQGQVRPARGAVRGLLRVLVVRVPRAVPGGEGAKGEAFIFSGFVLLWSSSRGFQICMCEKGIDWIRAGSASPAAEPAGRSRAVCVIRGSAVCVIRGTVHHSSNHNTIH